MSIIAYQKKKESKDFIRQMEPNYIFADKDAFLHYVKSGDSVVSDVELSSADVKALSEKGVRDFWIVKNEDEVIAFWRRVVAEYTGKRYGPCDTMGRPVDLSYPYDGNTVLWKMRELRAVDDREERRTFHSAMFV